MGVSRGVWLGIWWGVVVSVVVVVFNIGVFIHFLRGQPATRFLNRELYPRQTGGRETIKPRRFVTVLLIVLGGLRGLRGLPSRFEPLVTPPHTGNPEPFI